MVKPYTMAECLDCTWQSDAANAHPNAKRHAMAYGHHTHVTVERNYSYGPDPGSSTEHNQS